MKHFINLKLKSILTGSNCQLKNHDYEFENLSKLVNQQANFSNILLTYNSETVFIKKHFYLGQENSPNSITSKTRFDSRTIFSEAIISSIVETVDTTFNGGASTTLNSELVKSSSFLTFAAYCVNT